MVNTTSQMVEKTDINVDEQVEMLLKNAAAAELTTFHYCTILRSNLSGLQKEIVDTARIEDRNHFEALVHRIHELGGKLPEYMKAFHDMASFPPAGPPKGPTDVQSLLAMLVDAEQCAVYEYTHICNLMAGKNRRTYNLSLAILTEEIEHESWFSEFPGYKSFGYSPVTETSRRPSTSANVPAWLPGAA